MRLISKQYNFIPVTETLNLMSYVDLPYYGPIIYAPAYKWYQNNSPNAL